MEADPGRSDVQFGGNVHFGRCTAPLEGPVTKTFERKRVLFRVSSLQLSFLFCFAFVCLFLRQCHAMQSKPVLAISYFSVLRSGTPVPFLSVLIV